MRSVLVVMLVPCSESVTFAKRHPVDHQRLATERSRGCRASQRGKCRPRRGMPAAHPVIVAAVNRGGGPTSRAGSA